MASKLIVRVAKAVVIAIVISCPAAFGRIVQQKDSEYDTKWETAIKQGITANYRLTSNNYFYIFCVMLTNRVKIGRYVRAFFFFRLQ